MHLTQVTRYGCLYAINQLTRAMEAAKHLLRYSAGSANFSIVYKQGGFRLSAFPDANGGNNSDNGRSTSSHIMFLANAPTSFKMGLQRVTSQSAMEAELAGAVLTMKEAVFCSNMMLELDFDESFGSVPLYIDNTSALDVSGSRTCNPRAKHIARRYFFVQKLAEEGKISIHCVKTEDQLAELGPKQLSKHRRRYLTKLVDECKA